MHRCNEAYLDKRMASCSELPSNVVAQIRSEVQQQLEAKVDAVLGATIAASRDAATAPDAATAALAKQFKSLLDQGPSSAGAGAAMQQFCEDVLEAPAIASEIEPLIPLLQTYAASRLKEFSTGADDGGAAAGGTPGAAGAATTSGTPGAP